MAAVRGFAERIWARFPGTVVLLGLTVVGTLLYRTVWPGLFHLVRRDPDALKHGQVWRVISPVLVQPDAVPVAVCVFVAVGFLGICGERYLGTRRMVILWVAGALAGHVAGEWWQPLSGGVSVAGCGVLGGLAVWWVRMREPGPVSAGVGVLAIGGLFAGGRDIHGAALLAGFVVGAFVNRKVPPTYRGQVRSWRVPEEDDPAGEGNRGGAW